MDEECSRVTVRAIRRAIEACGILKIPRIVVHASHRPYFSQGEFYQQNKRFCLELLRAAERHHVMILKENMTDHNP